MIRGVFEHQLEQLQEELLIMSSKIEWNLVAAAAALAQRDLEISRALIAGDEQINATYIHLEQMCLNLIATQQPKARDLRLITAVMSIAGELERINDYAKGIAKINLQLSPDPLPPLVNDICQMAEKARQMLTLSINAFIERDVNAAYAIHASDREIDALYTHINQELLHTILHNSQQTAQANKLMWAAHNLERAGDRIGNICERVIFLVTGQILDISHDFPLNQLLTIP